MNFLNFFKKKSVLLIVGLLTLLLIVFGLYLLLNKEVDLDKLKSSVVQIYVYDEYDDMIATGSGVVAFSSDIVITNAHVIEDNYRLEIITEDDKTFNVSGILSYNKTKDIAILKLDDKTELKPVKINTKIETGDNVFAIGSPLGIKNTVSNGIISGTVEDNIEVYQHTAAISPGSSGGALFNGKGELVGITYATIEGGQNLNLAIPIKVFDDEYAKISSNMEISTKYYSFLSSSIIKTEIGNELLLYALNDEYSNVKNRFYIENNVNTDDYKKGTLKITTNLVTSYYITDERFSEISQYINATLYLTSGYGELYEPNDFCNTNGLKLGCVFEKTLDASQYKVLIFKIKNYSNNSIQELKDFLIEFSNSEAIIDNNENYIYSLTCENYSNCDEVETILNKFTSQ